MTRSSALALVAVLFAACGGGGPSHVEFTEVVPSDVTVDGFVTSTGFVVQGERPLAGDDAIDQVARAFYRFPHPAFPAEAEVVRAILLIGQEGIRGAPYTDLGDAVIDHVDLGPGLDATDFDAAALTADFGVLSTTPAIEEKALDITALVLADLAAGRDRTDLRIRMATGSDADQAEDFTIWNDAPNSGVTGSAPRVRVTVRVPVP
ncbi:MAG: hypothetical protein QNJ98_00970 [Planctomycetota bacterium]|nr:hypothetical protein [Planctomycetota bacterium]